MSIKHIGYMSCGFIRLMFLILILSTGHYFPAAAQTNSPEPERKIQFAPEAEKGADQLFKDAGAVAEKNPEDAIRLYRRALQSKPDALAERRKMALLYEKIGKPDAAASEYELINRAADSAQSNADLAGILEKIGVLPAAASTALHGAHKFPNDRALSLQAGSLLLKIGQADKALDFIKNVAQNRPEDKEIMFLLGQAYENNGNGAAALRAYLKSVSTGSGSDEYKKIFQRLEKQAVRVDSLWFFSPKGWERNKNMLFNATENVNIYVDVHASNDMNAVALKVVKEKMPTGMFEDIQMKGYEDLRKKDAELSKTSPDAPKGIITGRLPLFRTKPLDDKMKGLLAVASSSEEPSEFMKSVCTLVLPSANKIYTVTWVSSKTYQEGEKALFSLIDYIVLPQ